MLLAVAVSPIRALAAALTADMSPAAVVGTYLRSQVPVLVPGLVGGWLGPRPGLPKDSSLSGNATWALPVGAAIFGLDVGMWY